MDNQIMAEDEKYNLPSIDESPWLLGTHENKNSKLEKQTFFTINNNTSYVKKIVELHGKSIVASVLGWLILRDRVNSTIYSLWNPITRNSIILPDLPDLPAETEPETYIFTSPPFTDQCVLLLFCKGFVLFCNPMKDDCNWIKQRLEHEGEIVKISRAAVVNGDIYAYADLFDDNDDNDHGCFHTVFARLTMAVGSDVSLNNSVNSVNFDGSDVSSDASLNNSVNFEALSVECPSSRIVYKMFHRRPHFLVEACGNLYGVSIIPRQLLNTDGYDILKVFVWRFDLSEMDWVQVESLGDYAILLGDNCCTWCPARGRIEGNCVYMVNLASDTIHQYRLQDISYGFLSSHDNFQSFSDGPVWFMPYNPTRLPSLEKTIAERIQDTHVIENSKHVEELETMNREIPKSLLLQLPLDVITLIADRLHWFDCMNLRATCKKFLSKIPKPKWKANSSLPLFMFLKSSDGICELWDPCYQNNGSVIKKLPYSTSVVSTIEFSKDGWLMLRSHEGCYLQYMNLFTGESGEYPTESLAPGHSSFVFSSSPTSPDCLTIGISGIGHHAHVTISLLRAKEDQWFTVGFEIEGSVDFQSHYNSSPKYFDGSFHFLDENGNLGILKMENDGCSWEVYKGPPQEDEDTNRSECYVADLNGQPIYVFIEDVGCKIELYTFDKNEEVWVEVKSLGDFMLFVSSASSFSVAAKDSSMRNRIYLPKRIGNEMVFYSLDTGKYHTPSSKESYENYHGMISQSFSCWV
ncbi:uncharacterized protein LOC141646771 [Silene latifolia]|uniref:uncharacterized protein LOC141646771 n=1 Tax=Silene latifolia TaxID=37657 RepID=UPI003D76C620